MANSFKAIISDMDGVLWRGSQALPGMTDFFDFLFQREISFVLATNNSRNTPGGLRRQAGVHGRHGHPSLAIS